MLLKVAGVFPAAEVDVGLSVAAFGKTAVRIAQVDIGRATCLEVL